MAILLKKIFYYLLFRNFQIPNPIIVSFPEQGSVLSGERKTDASLTTFLISLASTQNERRVIMLILSLGATETTHAKRIIVVSFLFTLLTIRPSVSASRVSPASASAG